MGQFVKNTFRDLGASKTDISGVKTESYKSATELYLLLLSRTNSKVIKTKINPKVDAYPNPKTWPANK